MHILITKPCDRIHDVHNPNVSIDFIKRRFNVGEDRRFFFLSKVGVAEAFEGQGTIEL